MMKPVAQVPGPCIPPQGQACVLRVLLADHQVVMRQALRLLLSTDPLLDLVGEASDGREMLALASRLHPSVVILEPAMPHLNGVEAARRLRILLPDTRILVLASNGDEAHRLRMEAAGADLFLPKECSASELFAALHALSRVPRPLPPVHRLDRNTGLPLQRIPSLTTREREVLQLIAEGASNKQVADALGISIKTVEKHRQHLMDKLDIHETAGLTRHAIACGIIEGDRRRPSPRQLRRR